MVPVNQIRDYFIQLTEHFFETNLSSSNSEKYKEKFRRKFSELYGEIQSELQNELALRHALNPLFVIAIEFANQHPEHQNPEVLFEITKSQVLSIYEIMMLDYFASQKAKYEAAEDAWKTISDDMRVGNANLYDNEYFKLEMINDNEQAFGFDLNKCIYYDIFTKYNRQDLGPILCEYDYLLSNAYSNWIDFNRDKTIAQGSDKCTFRFSRKS